MSKNCLDLDELFRRLFPHQYADSDYDPEDIKLIGRSINFMFELEGNVHRPDRMFTCRFQALGIRYYLCDTGRGRIRPTDFP